MEVAEVIQNDTQVDGPDVSGGMAGGVDTSAADAQRITDKVTETGENVTKTLTEVMQEYVDIRDEQENETYLLIADAAASRAVESYANETQQNETEMLDVNATISGDQWSYLRSGVQMHSTLLLFMVLLVAALVGILLYREFSRGFRK